MIAVLLARALVAGGLTALEVTLRIPAGLDCIRAIADDIDGASAGAGTVLDASQYEAAAKAGATFVLSPRNICEERGGLSGAAQRHLRLWRMGCARRIARVRR